MNIPAIRTALGVALATVFSDRVSTEPPDVVNPPHAIISGPEPVVYSETWDAGHHLTFTVRVLVARNVPRAAQAALDAYMDDGAGSVYRALEDDKTLGGTVASAQVTQALNLGSIIVNDVTYAVVDFIVDVMT